MNAEKNVQKQKAPIEQPPVIVIIDDDSAVLNSLKFILEIEGFFVQTYADAHALPKANELPDRGCLIIDYFLSDANGLDVLSELRKQHVSLPAILITSYPSDTLRARAAQADVRIVEKPLLGNALIEALRDVLALRYPHLRGL